MKDWLVLDTDIGGDIDDTWALVMLLKMDLLDLRLITITGYDTLYQVELTAKLLTVAGRTDIPIAYNIPQDCNRGDQDRWVDDFSLKDYKGIIYSGTLQPLKEVVKASPDSLRVLSIGGKTNIAELLRNDELAVEKCILYSMQGALDPGFKETNIKSDIQAARQIMAYDVEKHIVPHETCGKTYLDGFLYQMVRNSKDPLVAALIDNYDLWWEDCQWNEHKQDPLKESSILFDPVTLMYMVDPDHFEAEDMEMYVDFDGYTHLNQGHMIRCATSILDERDLKSRMVKILLGN